MSALSAIVPGLPIGCRDSCRSLATIAAWRVAERLTFAGSWFQAFFVSVLIMASVGSTGCAISPALSPRSR